jgi:hypothetical protein
VSCFIDGDVKSVFLKKIDLAIKWRGCFSWGPGNEYPSADNDDDEDCYNKAVCYPSRCAAWSIPFAAFALPLEFLWNTFQAFLLAFFFFASS